MQNICSQYKYKCPHCKGEFVDASEGKEWVQEEKVRYFKCCPFCGEEMIGLSR